MLDEFRSTNITWDKATSRIYSPVTANASDENGRKLVVQIVNGGQVEDLTGATLHLYWETRDKLHDGLDVFEAVDLKKGEFELSYTTGMLSNKGVLNANLVLIDTVGRVVSERFKITVTEGIDNDAIQSENSFSSLTQALIDVSNLEQNYAPRLNDLTAQLQQIDGQKADVTYVDQTISTMTNGAIKGTYTTLTALQTAYPQGAIGPFLIEETQHRYIWDVNKLEWVSIGPYDPAEIADGTVSREKTDYLKPTFNNLVGTIEDGAYYPHDTGTITYDATKSTSGIITVTGGQKIKLENTGLGASNKQAHVFFWRESLSKNGGFIADGEFTVPANSVVMRVGFATTSKEKVAIFDASQEYGFADEFQKITKPEQLLNKVVTRESTTYINKELDNIFEENSFITDYSYGLDGNISTTNGLGSFEFPVKPNEQYEMKWVGFAETEVSNTYITFWGDSGFISSVQSQNFTVPNDQNIKTARVAIAPNGVQAPEIYLVGKKEKYVDNETTFHASQVEGLPNPYADISICGDSIATFEGQMVLGNRSYYPKSDVDDVTYTWWYKLINNNYWLKLLVNNSWSGSAVTPGKGNGTPHSDGATAIKYLSRDGIDPDIVIFNKGTNDFGNNVDLATFETEYRKVITNAKIRYPNAKLFFGTILYRSSGAVNTNGHTVEDFNNIIKTVTEEENVSVIDFYNCGIDASNATEFLIDGLHPNAAGQDLMYRQAVGAVTVDSEVVLARGGEPTLGIRLDKQDEAITDSNAALTAQLAEKVQNFKIKNEVVNGDFSQGTTGWNTTASSGFSVVDGVAEFTATAVNGRFEREIGVILADEIYYARAKVKADSGSVSMRATDVAVGGIIASHSGNNTYQLLSGIYKQTIDRTVIIRIIDTRGSGWTKIYADNILFINLTKTFGVGNEPTKREMDELMKVIPNQWWDGELSLTQKHFITWQLNLIRKNTNAIIALGGTII